LRSRYSAVCIMSIDGLMPPDLVKEPVLIGDFSAYGVFAQHTRLATYQATCYRFSSRHR
jgi:hypothetical protein